VACRIGKILETIFPSSKTKTDKHLESLIPIPAERVFAIKRGNSIKEGMKNYG